ncbi:MAG: hypothetical protein V5788_04635 [Shewanella sp.]
MSKDHQEEGYPAYSQHGDPTAGEQQAPQVPPGYYSYPPHMVNPYYYAPPMPHGMPPQHMAPPPSYGMPPQHMPPPGYGFPTPHMMHQNQGDPRHNHSHGAATQQEQNPAGNDPLLEQAQAMLEGAFGDEAGIFKELLGTIGMNDKEFWKGAIVGAAAALILSNENVRKGLMGAISGAGGMLKTGGESVKDAAVKTASNMQQNVTAGGEIFQETYAAGKEGFKESVERHQQTPEVEASESSETDLSISDESTTDTSIPKKDNE